ncbi:spermidine synthase-like [Clytia hemisphaerica]
MSDGENQKSLFKLDGKWFHETGKVFPGQAMSLEVEEVLFHQKSPYQDVLVFQSKTYGRVMVLDGMINSTSRDECAYQEMISFLPLNSHPNPKSVLVVGGGDGGVARDCAKHSKVERITMIEIDQMVVDASKEFLPEMAIGMSHPKVKLFVGDGLEYLENNEDTYDVIIADLSDPDDGGPAAKLFQETFYKLMKDRLNPGGIICAQGEVIWLDLEQCIKPMIDFCQKHFPSVTYACNNVPTYTCGIIGYVICSLEKDKDFRTPLHVFTEEEMDQMNLKYYNQDMHTGAFALPTFVKKKLNL